MKIPAFLLASFAAAAVIAPAGEVKLGDPLSAVVSTLGQPRGQVETDGRQLLYYDRGEVEIQAGAVTRVALRTPEEQAELQARAEQAQAERDARRAQLVAAGTALRNEKLADPGFKEAPLSYQVSFWEDFVRRYPDVSVVEPLTVARLRRSEELAEKRRQDEVEALRLAESKARLEAAEREPTFYPLFTGYGYRRHHHHHHDYPPRLGPFEYTFYSSPLPPYTTPSGNPAGNLRTPEVEFPYFKPAFPPSVRPPHTQDGGDSRAESRRRGFDRDWRDES